jgi:hypothetical protein
VADKGYVLAFLVYSAYRNVNISADGGWATAYLILANPENGESLPTEPGLAVIRREGEVWQVTLPSDPGWPQAVREAPADLLPDAAKEMWLAMFEAGLAELPKQRSGIPAALGGGEDCLSFGSTLLTTHTSPAGTLIMPSLYIPQTMFNLFASKAGVVWQAKDDVPNGYENDSNYLIIKDRTTTPPPTSFTCTWPRGASRPPCELPARPWSGAVYRRRRR